MVDKLNIFLSTGDVLPRDYRTAPKHIIKYYICKDHGVIESPDVIWRNIEGNEIPCCGLCRLPLKRKDEY